MIFSFLQGKMCEPEKSGVSQGFCVPERARSSSGEQFAKAWKSQREDIYSVPFVCFNHFSPKTSIIDSHHLLLVSSHVLNSLVAFYGNFRSSPLIPFKILQKLSLLLFGGNVAMWACKVSVVSNLVGLLTRLCSRFSGLLPNLGKSGKSLAPVCSRLEFLALSLRP